MSRLDVGMIADADEPRRRLDNCAPNHDNQDTVGWCHGWSVEHRLLLHAVERLPRKATKGENELHARCVGGGEGRHQKEP